MSARCSRFLKGQTGLETPCNACEYGSEANKIFTEIMLWEMAAVAKRSQKSLQAACTAHTSSTVTTLHTFMGVRTHNAFL